jgi:hypothetical protein
MAFLNKGKPPKGGRYFACSNALREAGCANGRYWKCETVERAIFHNLGKARIEDAFPKGRSPGEHPTHYYNERVGVLEEKLKNAIDFVFEHPELKNDPTVGARVRDWKKQVDVAKAERDAALRAEVTRPDLEAAKENWKAARSFSERIRTAGGDELVELRRKLILQLRSTLAEVRFSSLSIHVSIELPSRPKEIIGPPTGLMFEERTVEGIDRYFLLHLVYTEHPGVLRRLGLPAGSDRGAFVSTFAKIA